MNPSSILIKSVTGEIYKITDLIKGIKEPLKPSELAGYNMHPQSGVLKDTDGRLIDLIELLTSGNRVVISEDSFPENPSTTTLYVNKNAKSIAVYDEEDKWVELSGSDVNDIFNPINALNDTEIMEVLDVFTKYN